MLEIDGELFNDPFETFRKEQTEAIINVLVETAVECLYHRNDIELLGVITDMAKVQIHMIQAHRAFPPKFAEGGVVCHLPDTAGDIVISADNIIPAKEWDIEMNQ